MRGGRQEPADRRRHPIHGGWACEFADIRINTISDRLSRQRNRGRSNARFVYGTASTPPDTLGYVVLGEDRGERSSRAPQRKEGLSRRGRQFFVVIEHR